MSHVTWTGEPVQNGDSVGSVLATAPADVSTIESGPA